MAKRARTGFAGRPASLTRARPDRPFRIGTGELTDSLALDRLTGLSRRLVPYFAELPNATLELKTKSAEIGELLNLDSRGRTVVSWSVNAPAIVERDPAGLRHLLRGERQVVKARLRRDRHPARLRLLQHPDRRRARQVHDVRRTPVLPRELDHHRHRVVLRFAPHLAPLVTSANHHPGEEKEVLADGRVEYRVVLTHLGEIRQWIAGFGGDVEVVAPRVLRGR